MYLWIGWLLLLQTSVWKWSWKKLFWCLSLRFKCSTDKHFHHSQIHTFNISLMSCGSTLWNNFCPLFTFLSQSCSDHLCSPDACPASVQQDCKGEPGGVLWGLGVAAMWHGPAAEGDQWRVWRQARWACACVYMSMSYRVAVRRDEQQK